VKKDYPERFLEDLLHALHVPLTAVRTLIESAQARASDRHEVDRLLQNSLREVEALSSLLANLLFLAKAEAGALPLDLSRLELSALAGECVDRFRPLAEAGRIELSLRAAGPVLASADGAQLRRLVEILLDNALKCTPAGGRVVLEVASERHEARLTVSDTGVGIPREMQALIFERFFQADPDEARRRGGVGLGLSIARAIAQAHRARLTVESEPGKGSSFTLLLKPA